MRSPIQAVLVVVIVVLVDVVIIIIITVTNRKEIISFRLLFKLPIKPRLIALRLLQKWLKSIPLLTITKSIKINKMFIIIFFSLLCSAHCGVIANNGY